MFLKRTSRPAYAFASASAGSVDKQSWSEKKFDSFAFASSQSNDFNSFSSSSSASNQNKAPKKPNKKKVTFEIPGRRIAIIAAIVIGIVLVIGLVAGLLMSKSNDITYEDNTFVCYQEPDGTYRLAMNGKVLKDVFTGEVKLTPAKNNSFAYVEAIVDDALNVYILDNNKLELICDGIDNVLALADYKPGVVCKYGDRVEYYYDDTQTSLSGKDDYLPQNFVISPDGTAIAYNKKNRNNPEINDLFLCTADRATPKAISTGSVSMSPVSISNNGEYLVAYVENNLESRTLYLISENSKYKIGGVDGSFDTLIAANADATEIVFTTKSGLAYRSYVYNCTEIKKEETSAHHISNGYAIPQINNPKVCARATFKKCYFQDPTPTAPLTLYVNKKYEAAKVSDFIGQIDSEEKYLYIINNQKGDDELIQIKLLGEKTGKANGKNSTRIGSDVKKFTITNKGNIYYTDSHGDLYFYKLTKGKSARIAKSINDFTFYNYSNQVIFEKSDISGVKTVYSTEEGSSQEAFTFGKVEPTALPTITNAYSKKTYAYYHDETSDTYYLFYSSNGKSFSKTAECDNIVSADDSTLEEIIGALKDTINSAIK